MNDSCIKDTEHNGTYKRDQERRKAHGKLKQTSNSLLAKTLL